MTDHLANTTRLRNDGESGPSSRLGLALGGLLALTALATPVHAQEFVQTFVNPSFGGNPFNSDHLLAIAALDRPDAPEDPDEPPLEGDALLLDQLLSSVSASRLTGILSRISATTIGTDEFTVGDQRITIVRNATDTRVTFVNTSTGETRVFVIPLSQRDIRTSAAGSPVAAAEGALLGPALSSWRSSPSPVGASTARASGAEGRLLATSPMAGSGGLSPVALGMAPLGPARGRAARRGSGPEGALLALPPLQ